MAEAKLVTCDEVEKRVYYWRSLLKTGVWSTSAVSSGPTMSVPSYLPGVC